MINFEDHINLVHHIVQKKFGQRPGYRDYEDYCQEGFAGLWYACKHFDENYGVAFSTYAVPHIEGRIRRYKRDYFPIKVSRSKRDIWSTYQYFSNRGYTDEESLLKIQKKMEIDLTMQELQEIKFMMFEPLSANSTIYDSDGKETEHQEMFFDNRVDIEDQILVKFDYEGFLEMLKESDPKVYQIVEQIKFGVVKQEDIAFQIGRSQAQVSRCLKKLKVLYNEFNQTKSIRRR